MSEYDCWELGALGVWTILVIALIPVWVPLVAIGWATMRLLEWHHKRRSRL